MGNVGTSNMMLYAVEGGVMYSGSLVNMCLSVQPDWRWTPRRSQFKGHSDPKNSRTHLMTSTKVQRSTPYQAQSADCVWLCWQSRFSTCFCQNQNYCPNTLHKFHCMFLSVNSHQLIRFMLLISRWPETTINLPSLNISESRQTNRDTPAPSPRLLLRSNVRVSLHQNSCDTSGPCLISPWPPLLTLCVCVCVCVHYNSWYSVLQPVMPSDTHTHTRLFISMQNHTFCLRL